MPVAENGLTENDIAAGVNLNDFTHYRDLQPSEQRTAGKPPERLGFEVAYIMMESSKDGRVPVTYKTEVISENSETWKNAMEEEIQSLNKMSTWELVQLPTMEKVVKTRWVLFMMRNGEDVAV